MKISKYIVCILVKGSYRTLSCGKPRSIKSILGKITNSCSNRLDSIQKLKYLKRSDNFLKYLIIYVFTQKSKITKRLKF